MSESRKAAFGLRIAARVSLPRTVCVGFEPTFIASIDSESIAVSSAVEPAKAQDQTRNCTTAAGLDQSVLDTPIWKSALREIGLANGSCTRTDAVTGRDAAVTSWPT